MQVHLRKEAKRTNSSTLDHVADCESFYRLILWRTPRAIGAADRLDMTPSLLVATAVADILVAGLRFPDFGMGSRTWMLAS